MDYERWNDDEIADADFKAVIDREMEKGDRVGDIVWRVIVFFFFAGLVAIGLLIREWFFKS